MDLRKIKISKRDAPDWRKCPVGTVAYSHTGTRWTKQADGWWRANGGDAFTRPGTDAMTVMLPVEVVYLDSEKESANT